MEITFTHPEYLWFLVVMPLLVIIHFTSLKSTKRKALKFANFEAIARVSDGEVISSNISLLFIRLFIVILFVLALSGTIYWYSGAGSNFDFVLAIDASNSMLAKDFSPNRLESAKINAQEFLDLIFQSNKVGVISFSSTSIIEKELSDKFSEVRKVINNIQVSKTGGTDLGEAIITSTNLLINTDRPRIIILLTDGQSNVGIPLKEALEYAKSKEAIIYSIGIGSEKGGEYFGNVSLKIDEETLKIIAEDTDGKYFKAENDQSLREVYKQIAAITETKIKRDLGVPFLVISLILILIEWIMINTRYRTIP